MKKYLACIPDPCTFSVFGRLWKRFYWELCGGQGCDFIKWLSFAQGHPIIYTESMKRQGGISATPNLFIFNISSEKVNVVSLLNNFTWPPISQQ